MSTVDNAQNRKEPLALGLAKLMLAVAWAPGKIEHEDLLKVQRYLSSKLNVNDAIKQALNLYQEYPVDAMERRRLARRFASDHPSSQARQEVIQRLNELLPGDEAQCMPKILAIQEIKEALVEDQINFLKKVHYKLTRTPFPAKISEFGREAFLHEYLANPIYFRLKLRFGDNFKSMRLTPAKAEKLSLEMALVSLTVYADQILLPEELEKFSQYLEKYWNLDEAHIELLITMSLCREASEAQIPKFCERYRDMSSLEERQRLYLLLGEVARVDHLVTRSEQNVLEVIADALEIPAGVRQSVYVDPQHGEVEVE